jgi:uncharacterized protein DUF5343
MADENQSDSGFTAPYVAWGSFENLIDRMAKEGTPQRIDRSYLSNLAGSTQSQLLKSLRDLDLIDEQMRPTEGMKALIGAEDREALFGELIQRHYGEALALGTNATQSQLEELFTRSYGVGGSTRRKSIAFFLAGAKAGGLSVSQHFKTPKVSRPAGTSSRRRSPQTPQAPQTPTQPSRPSGDPKDRYITLLLKKAEESDMSPELLDRIERVIGVADPESTKTSPKPSGGDADS